MRPAGGLRSAVVVPVPEAAAAVDAWRERTCDARPSAGIPPHVTLLFPFAPAREIAEGIVGALASLAGAEKPFRFELAEARRFPGILYLAPAPPEPFVRLTEAIVARFPGFLPYEGAFDTIVPHLTVAQGDELVLAEAEAAVRPLLPIGSVAREAVLLEETEPEWARSRVRTRLTLGRPAR